MNTGGASLCASSARAPFPHTPWELERRRGAAPAPVCAGSELAQNWRKPAQTVQSRCPPVLYPDFGRRPPAGVWPVNPDTGAPVQSNQERETP